MRRLPSLPPAAPRPVGIAAPRRDGRGDRRRVRRPWWRPCWRRASRGAAGTVAGPTERRRCNGQQQAVPTLPWRPPRADRAATRDVVRETSVQQHPRGQHDRAPNASRRTGPATPSPAARTHWRRCRRPARTRPACRSPVAFFRLDLFLSGSNPVLVCEGVRGKIGESGKANMSCACACRCI